MTKSEMRQVGVHETKTHLSELLRLVEAGEQIEITRGGRPVAILSPSPRVRQRVLASARGTFTVPDDFDEPLPIEIEDLFHS